MIEVGDRLPDLLLVTDTGEEVNLSDVKKAVIWFYPKAMTPGCTTEACDFRDAKTVLSEAGYSIYGVSPDAPDRNARFVEKESLNFPPNEWPASSTGAPTTSVMKWRTSSA